MSGGYADSDFGDIIIYEGHGGRDGHKRVGDQEWRSGNLGRESILLIKTYLFSNSCSALKQSCVRGLPVRVLRGYQVKSAFAPAEGYRYDGLYYVARYWEGSDAGFKVGIDPPLPC